MKALEILKSILQTANDMGASEDIKRKYIEAIKELESLRNRSCDNCKTKNCSVKRILVEKEEINTDYFNCNDWEKK